MKKIDSHTLLAKEGWPYIALSLVAALLVTFIWGWLAALVLWLVVVFVLQFFRDPHRPIPQEEGLIVSPADGKVIFTGIVQDPYLDREAYKISVFMNVFSVHSNRSPLSATVKKIWYHAGSFLNAALDKASEKNERNAMWIQTDKKQDIVSVQVAGLVARRILCYAKEGEQLQRGQRYGFIRFGSRVDLYLPKDFTPGVELGDNVSAGTSVLGELS